MATSQYFNNYNSKYSEQRLIEDVITESFKIMGFDAYYIPNDNTAARDLIYGEDPLRKFTRSFAIEMYLSKSTGYEGAEDMFSKFGLEIRNNIKVMLSHRTFHERVDPLITRPREGDLVWVPFLNGTGEIFEIKFVEQAKDFHMLGRKNPYFYELEMEKFKYSQEILQTGQPDVDNIALQSGYNMILQVSPNNQGYTNNNYIIGETVTQAYDNSPYKIFASATVQDWDYMTNQLTVSNIKGAFAPDTANNLYGRTSTTRRFVTVANPHTVSSQTEAYDNQIIENQANNYLDFTESNPFGNL